MKKQLFIFLLTLLPMVASAFTGEAEIDGIKYYIITKGQTAEVRQKKYTGDIVIPSSIEYEGVTCSVASIGEKAFYKCNELTSVTIPNTVSSIGTSAFDGCSSLSSITIPQNVTSIGDFTFQNCGLINLTIPNGVTSIGIQAFLGCGKLTSVTIPNSVKSIGKLAFSGCKSMERVIISDITAWCDIYFEEVSSNPLYFAKHLYLCESTEITDLEIPEDVTRIRNYAFGGCSGITSVTIPNSVKSIGERSFYACEGLKLLTIGSDVTDIYKEAFAYCKELTEVYCYAKKIPYTVQVFGNSFVEYATLYVPASLIDQYKAKDPWSGFGKIEILDYIDGIYYNLNGHEAEVTYRDDNYNSYSGTVVIPESVTYRGKNFSVTRIDDWAFASCPDLTSVTIPNSVNNIGSHAFSGCSGLQEVRVLATTPPFVFDNTFSNYSATLSVPEASISSYQATSPWSNFTTLQALSGEDPTIEKCEKPTILYANGELTFGCATEGVEFHWSINNGTNTDGKGSKVTFSPKTTVSVYASKDGYKDSDTATLDISGSSLKGDVNNNGGIDIGDAVTIVNFLVGKTATLSRGTGVTEDMKEPQ